MDLTHVLLNNSQLGKISKEQRAGDWEVWQTSLHNPDLAEYAKLCGGHGARVTDPGKPDDALAAAIAHPGPSLVEIVSDPDLI
jgi:pyruvate oxidase